MKIHRNDYLRIIGTGSYVPARVITNEQIAADTHHWKGHFSADWVKENLGIERRHVAEADEFSSDLATKACERALNMAGLVPNDIDLLIVATSTPDRVAPSTACIVQDKLGMQNKRPAFDIQAVCSGFLYALEIGSSFINNGSVNKVLVIGADTFSKITNWDARDCCFFGDGAGAVVLHREDRPICFYASKLYADGSGRENFTVKPYDEYYTMNARAVYDTGTTVLPKAIREITLESGFGIGDIKHIIPHQPSIRVLNTTAEILGVCTDTIHKNMREYANTAGATIPLLLDEVNRSGKLKNNEIVVFAAVGSGWTWGAGIYEWKNT